jgi:hypothetical protein
LGYVLIIRLPNYDKSREYVESEGYITLNNITTPLPEAVMKVNIEDDFWEAAWPNL